MLEKLSVTTGEQLSLPPKANGGIMVVMLVASMAVTFITQAITSFLNSDGKRSYLLRSAV
jgi:hypothetical protein